MNVDPDGKIAWWIASALVGAALNALPMLLNYYYKHRTLRGFNWWVFGRSAAVGAITSIGGAGLYRAVASIGGSLITRVIALAGYGPKAYILNTIAKGKKPTLSGLYSSYITSGVASGLNVFNRLKSIYRYGGKKAVTRYIKAIR